MLLFLPHFILWEPRHNKGRHNSNQLVRNNESWVFAGFCAQVDLWHLGVEIPKVPQPRNLSIVRWQINPP